MKYELKELKNNIKKWYKKANELEIEEGKNWYKKAHEEADNILLEFESLCDIDLNKISQIVSILSPQTDWLTNLKNTRLFLAYGMHARIFATDIQKDLCLKVIEGSYSIPERARKTFNFYNNILSPESLEYCTIDRHAFKIATNSKKAGYNGLTIKQYDLFKAAYIAFADELKVKPCELQAITWLTYKRIVKR